MIATANFPLTSQHLMARLDCAIAAYTGSCRLPLPAAATYARGVATGAKTEIKLLAETLSLTSLAQEIEQRWEMATGDCPA